MGRKKRDIIMSAWSIFTKKSKKQKRERFVDDGKGNVTNHDKLPTHPFALTFNGDNNTLDVDQTADLVQCKIYIRGSGNRIEIGRNCHIRGIIFVNGNNSKVIIKDGASSVGMRISGGDGRTITIGKDCMFSRNVEIRSWDEHPIYSIDDRRIINFGADVSIGDHVWLSEGVTVNKGVAIPSGCVIGAGATVTKSLDTPNAIYVGTPARMVRSRIAWSRSPKEMDFDAFDFTLTGTEQEY